MASIPFEQQQQIIERIRYIIAQQGVSQHRFAQHMAMSDANLSKHLKGRLPITIGLVNRISLDWGVSRRWLMTGEDVPYAKPDGTTLVHHIGSSAPKGLPVYDIDATAGFGSLDRMFTDDRIDGYVSLPGLNETATKGRRLVRVSGNSMSPRIPNGSFIAISDAATTSINWGHIYVVATDTNRMVKTLLSHSNPSLIILHSENREFPDVTIERSDIQGLYRVDAIINLSLT